MDAPAVDPSTLRTHVAAMQSKYPIKILGLLPRGSAAHVFEEDALDFLAEKTRAFPCLDFARPKWISRIE